MDGDPASSVLSLANGSHGVFTETKQISNDTLV